MPPCCRDMTAASGHPPAILPARPDLSLRTARSPPILTHTGILGAPPAGLSLSPPAPLPPPSPTPWTTPACEFLRPLLLLSCLCSSWEEPTPTPDPSPALRPPEELCPGRAAGVALGSSWEWGGLAYTVAKTFPGRQICLFLPSQCPSPELSSEEQGLSWAPPLPPRPQVSPPGSGGAGSLLEVKHPLSGLSFSS